MKSRITLIASIGVIALALVAGVAFAQGGDDAESMHHHMGMGTMHHGFMGGGDLGLPLHQLNLSDDQKTQVQQIMKSEHANMKPLMQQEFQSRQQLFQLITSGNFDQAKAAAIATQESQTHVQLEIEHAKIASQIYQLLDSTQKAKVSDMIAKHQQMMQEHMQKQNSEQAPPDQQ